MITRLLYILLLFGVLSSCSKVSRDDRKSIDGSYEWYYSFDGYTETNSSLEITDKFAVKIKKNGKVTLYKNGKEEKSGKLSVFSKDDETVHVTVKWEKWESSSFDIEADQVVYPNWPFEGQTNYFTKFEY